MFVVNLLGLLLGVAFSTWIGTRLGAFAIMRVAFPLPFYGLYAHWLATLPEEQVQAATCSSLLSLLMVFSFVFSYHLGLRLFGERWEPLRGAVLLLLGAWGLCLLLRRLTEPLQHLLGQLPLSERLWVSQLVALLLVGAGHLLLRLPPGDRSAAPAACSLGNLLLRLVTLTGVVTLLHDPWFTGTLLFFALSSIPRITVELSVGTHAANGARSGRHVLAGMPLGLLPSVGFCVLLGQLLGRVPRWWAFGLAVGVSLCLSVALLLPLLGPHRPPAPAPA